MCYCRWDRPGNVWGAEHRAHMGASVHKLLRVPKCWQQSMTAWLHVPKAIRDSNAEPASGAAWQGSEPSGARRSNFLWGKKQKSRL